MSNRISNCNQTSKFEEYGAAIQISSKIQNKVASKLKSRARIQLARRLQKKIDYNLYHPF